MVRPNNRPTRSRVTVDVDKRVFDIAVEFCEDNQDLIEKVHLLEERDKNIIYVSVYGNEIMYKIKKYLYDMLKTRNLI